MPFIQPTITRAVNGKDLYIPAGGNPVISGNLTVTGDLDVSGDATVDGTLRFPGNNTVSSYDGDTNMIIGTPGDLLLDPVGNVKTQSSIYAEGIVESYWNPANVTKYPYRAALGGSGMATIAASADSVDVNIPLITGNVTATSRILVSYASDGSDCGALWVSAYGGGFGIFRENAPNVPVDVVWMIVAF